MNAPTLVAPAPPRGRDERKPGRRLRRVGVALGCSLGALVIAVLAMWAAGVLAFAGPGGPRVRTTLATSFAVLAVAVIVALFTRRRRLAVIVFAAALLLVGAWWSTIRPSNDRAWQPDVAVLPSATIDGGRVTVRNIRNFDYRTETDFTPRYYDRTFDLARLDRVDLVAVYWMGPAIAHLFLTFGFGDDHLAISIEARKERSEGYSALGGFFRQYELVYVVADERDVIRLRTNYRKDPPEDVYLFRTRASLDNGRRVFLDYMRAINELHERPRFYNTLTTNCTNVILTHTRVNPGHVPFSWKILLSGYAPEYIYEAGRLDGALPFEELKRRSHINAAAQAADQAPDFSQRIRAGLPAPVAP
ncbi:MAG TPA: DUF4105 domain-containing protein [Methylomirabilota bacterium]|nr:DUF4105 domain-containing protein [Methylomirabilota bacterium]